MVVKYKPTPSTPQDTKSLRLYLQRELRSSSGQFNNHTADENIHFGDAPEDGLNYVRKDGEWVAEAGLETVRYTSDATSDLQPTVSAGWNDYADRNTITRQPNEIIYWQWPAGADTYQYVGVDTDSPWTTVDDDFVQLGLASTSHSDLDDLNADDHTQYYNQTRGDIRYYPRSELNGGALDSLYVNKSGDSNIGTLELLPSANLKVGNAWLGDTGFAGALSYSGNPAPVTWTVDAAFLWYQAALKLETYVNGVRLNRVLQLQQDPANTTASVNISATRTGEWGWLIRSSSTFPFDLARLDSAGLSAYSWLQQTSAGDVRILWGGTERIDVNALGVNTLGILGSELLSMSTAGTPAAPNIVWSEADTGIYEIPDTGSGAGIGFSVSGATQLEISIFGVNVPTAFSADTLTLPQGSESAPTLIWGETDTGLYGLTGGVAITVDGVTQLTASTFGINAPVALSSTLITQPPGSAAAPTLVWGETDTGFYGFVGGVGISVDGATVMDWNPFGVAARAPFSAETSVDLKDGIYTNDSFHLLDSEGELGRKFYLIADSIATPNGGIDGDVDFTTDGSGLISGTIINDGGSGYGRNFIAVGRDPNNAEMCWFTVTVTGGAITSLNFDYQSGAFTPNQTIALTGLDSTSGFTGEVIESWAYQLYNGHVAEMYIDAINAASLAIPSTAWKYNNISGTVDRTIALIALGGNDAGNVDIGGGLAPGGGPAPITATDVRLAYEALIQDLKGKNFTRIISVLPGYNEFGANWTTGTDVVRQAIRDACANEGITEIWQPEITNINETLDALHPTQKGQDVLKRDYYSRMKPIAAYGEKDAALFGSAQIADILGVTSYARYVNGVGYNGLTQTDTETSLWVNNLKQLELTENNLSFETVGANANSRIQTDQGGINIAARSLNGDVRLVRLLAGGGASGWWVELYRDGNIDFRVDNQVTVELRTDLLDISNSPGVGELRGDRVTASFVDGVSGVDLNALGVNAIAGTFKAGLTGPAQARVSAVIQGSNGAILSQSGLNTISSVRNGLGSYTVTLGTPISGAASNGARNITPDASLLVGGAFANDTTLNITLFNPISSQFQDSNFSLLIYDNNPL